MPRASDDGPAHLDVFRTWLGRHEDYLLVAAGLVGAVTTAFGATWWVVLNLVATRVPGLRPNPSPVVAVVAIGFLGVTAALVGGGVWSAVVPDASLTYRRGAGAGLLAGSCTYLALGVVGVAYRETKRVPRGPKDGFAVS
jgi:hypothetical protein